MILQKDHHFGMIDQTRVRKGLIMILSQYLPILTDEDCANGCMIVVRHPVGREIGPADHVSYTQRRADGIAIVIDIRAVRVPLGADGGQRTIKDNR